MRFTRWMEGRLLNRKIALVLVCIAVMIISTACHRKSNIYGKENNQANKDIEDTLQEESRKNMPRFQTDSSSLTKEYQEKGYQIEEKDGQIIIRDVVTELGYRQEDDLGIPVLNIVIDDNQIMSNEEELESLHNLLETFFMTECSGYEADKVEECISCIPELGSVDYSYDENVTIVAQYLQEQIHMTLYPKD